MKGRYYYLGPFTLELTFEGELEHLDVALLDERGRPVPAADLAAEAVLPLVQPLQEQPSAPTPEEESTYSLGERGVMGSIRAVWVWLFGLICTGTTFAADNAASLGLPQWAIFGIGLTAAGIAYGAKRFALPDTKF